MLVTNIGHNPDFIRNHCVESNIPFVDISVDLKQAENTSRPIDYHPSVKANKVYAKKLYDYLKSALSNSKN